MPEQLYEYRWGNNKVRAKLKGRKCRIVKRGKRNTVMLEFIDTGERFLTSGNSIKKYEQRQ